MLELLVHQVTSRLQKVNTPVSTPLMLSTVVHILCFHLVKPWSSNASTSKNQVGLRCGDLEGHSTRRQRPIQWSGNCRFNQRLTQIPYPVRGDFWITMYL